MFTAIKIFINGESKGYLSRDWNITEDKSEVNLYNLDKIELKEVKRQAIRFQDGYDYDEQFNLECRIVKWKIYEYELEL